MSNLESPFAVSSNSRRITNERVIHPAWDAPIEINVTGFENGQILLDWNPSQLMTAEQWVDLSKTVNETISKVKKEIKLAKSGVDKTVEV